MTIEGWLGFSLTTFWPTKPARAYFVYTWSRMCVGQKMAAQFLLTKGNVSLFILLDGHSFTACDEACPACGTCTQLSLYTESDLVLHVPSSFSIVCNKTNHAALNLNQNPACQWSITVKERSPSKVFVSGPCFLNVATSYMHYVTRNLWSLPDLLSTCSNHWNLVY